MSRPYWIIAGLLTLAAWALAAWLYPSLPQRVPTPWNIEGKVDGWGDKSWATFLMPGMMIAFLILFAFLPALSPKHFEVDSFRGAGPCRVKPVPFSGFTRPGRSTARGP